MLRQPSYAPQNPSRRYARDVVRRAQSTLATHPAVSPIAPQLTTTRGVDGSGNVYTIRTAFYELDNYDDPAAIYYEG